MANISIRGLDELALQQLKQSAAQQGVSMNSYIVSILLQRVGMQQPERKQTWHDLDHLAGTWTEEDERAFKQNTAHFEKIDPDLWEQS